MWLGRTITLRPHPTVDGRAISIRTWTCILWLSQSTIKYMSRKKSDSKSQRVDNKRMSMYSIGIVQSIPLQQVSTIMDTLIYSMFRRSSAIYLFMQFFLSAIVYQMCCSSRTSVNNVSSFIPSMYGSGETWIAFTAGKSPKSNQSLLQAQERQASSWKPFQHARISFFC